MVATDPKSTTKSVLALNPITTSSEVESVGAGEGTVIDTKGFDYLTVYIAVGAISGGGTLDCKLQSSAVAGSGFADITGASWTQLDDTGDNQILVGQIRCFELASRYVNVVATAAGANSVVSAVGVLHGAADTAEYLSSSEYSFDT